MHEALIASWVVASAIVGMGCKFPDYFVVASEAGPGGDSTVGADGSSADAPFSGVTCEPSGTPAGSATACACGAVTTNAGDAGADAPSNDASDAGSEASGGDGAVDPGLQGLAACMIDGGLGTCSGCTTPSDEQCNGVSVPSTATCVPGGVVHLGVVNVNVCAPSGCAVEEPEHTVAIRRFLLDIDEVTVGRFRNWWSAGHVTPASGSVVFTAGDGTTVAWQGGWAAKEPTLSTGIGTGNDGTWLGASVSTNDALSINFVDWTTALAFCVADGGRLPTEAEWEAAASGRSDRLFPREAPGSKTEAPTAAMLPCTRAISAVGGSDDAGSASCGWPNALASDGFSVDGALDMAGSLAEWVLDVAPSGGAACTSNCYGPGPFADPIVFNLASTLHGVRGGSYQDTDPSKLRAQARAFDDGSTQASTVGFRCARN